MKKQALVYDEYHYGECTRTVGPRGGITERVTVWRRNGATRTWVRSPERFRVPVKHGMRDYTYVDETNAHLFHTADDCPLVSLRKSLCPQCGATVQVGALNFYNDVQRTECPNGHQVARQWNGPEREEWGSGTPGEPYGWSAWRSV